MSQTTREDRAPAEPLGRLPAADGIPAAAPRRRRYRLTRLLVAAAVVAVAAFFLVPKLGGARRSLLSLSGTDPWWLGFALAAELASLVAFTFGTRALLTPGQSRPSLPRILRIDLATIALSHAVPAGSAAGTALGYRLLTTSGVPPVEAGFAKVSQSLLSGVVLQLLLWSALAVSIPLHGSSPAYLVTTAAGALMIGLLVAAGALLTRHPAAVRRWVVWVTDRVPRVRGEAVGEAVAGVAEQLRMLLRSPRRLAWAFLWSAANWLFDAMCLWACLRALGHAASYDELMVSFAVASVLSSLPVTPAGLGLVEGGLVPTLIGLGSPASVAVLGTLAWRLFNFWLPLPLGAAAYMGLPTAAGPRSAVRT